MDIRRTIALCTGIFAIGACSSADEPVDAPYKVEIVATETGFQLLRGGEPYVIKGTGMAIDDFENLAAHGGNSIRNWSTIDDSYNTQDILDAAHANGITVALCLEMRPERSGFDYDDADAVAEQFSALRKEVLKYRDHPALLVWIIGNELNHGYTNSKVYDAVNDVAGMIHELDPNHPTTTTVAGFGKNVIDDIENRAPNIDFISFQLYGGLFGLPQQIRQGGFSKPFMVTEWGTIGFWEVDETEWGAPIEATSSVKADIFLRGQQEILASLGDQLVGSYAFVWGQKQERTPTWFGMFTEDGEATEVIDVMHFLWNDAWPEQRSPQIRSMQLNGQDASASVTVVAGGQLSAAVDAIDPDNDSLTFRWELKPESNSTKTGGDFEERIANLEGLIDEPTLEKTFVTAPGPGAYRLFVYVYDGQGQAGHANIPFRVRSEGD